MVVRALRGSTGAGRALPSRAHRLAGGSLVAGSLAFANLASYAFTMVAARRLGPAEYGAFAAAMALILIVNVAALGLQVTVARAVAVSRQGRADVVRAARRAGWRIGLAAAAVIIVSSPVLRPFLNLEFGALGLVALAAFTLTVIGAQVGALQGALAWSWFAVVHAALGIGRIALGWIAVTVGPTARGALTGVVLGLVVTAVAGWWAERRLLASGEPGQTEPVASLARQAFTSTSVLFGFYVLSNIDVVIVRGLFAQEESGLYAAGLILTKAVVFLPYFVSVLLFPRLARGGSTHLHLWGLAAVLVLGGVVVALTAAMPSVVLAFVGGAEYAPVRSWLWLFAAVGALLAGIHVLVMTAIARQHLRALWGVWVGLAVVALAGVLTSHWQDLLVVVACVHAGVLVALVGATRKDVVRSGQELAVL